MYIFSPSPHLDDGSWVDFEHAAANALVATMTAELSKLEEKVTAERVHKTRVSLRRWFSVWSILSDDGWEQSEFESEVLKPFRKLLSRLGEVRDLDVNLELSEKFQCRKKLLKFLKKKRRKAEQKLERYVDKKDMAKLLQKIEPYLHSRKKVLSELDKDEEGATPFERFDAHIRQQEDEVKEMAGKASSPEELHKLRLGIKKWRYLLTECLGVTNLDLVASQQLLGEVHDIDRLLEVMKGVCRKDPAISMLKAARQERLDTFQPYRANLPYGLRPGITSWKEPIAARR